MRQFILLAVLAGFLGFNFSPALALDRPPLPIRGAEIFNQNDTSNATFAAIDVDAGEVVHVFKFGVSLETADTITVKCNTTTKVGPLYFGATSGLVDNLLDVDFTCAAGEDLNITKGSAGTKVTSFGVWRQE